MHLKSVTLKGFKSFPDRTRIEMGPGVSVVIGPNGSGKSNITDAVLWAMGEQSPLAVRGQSMQDVIFGGTPGRQAARSAEVELVLDDSDGILGLGTPEVSLVRRLDRTGEGEYRIAGARCRLGDVIELLAETGLGRESHSVISQGRVESIVTSKPRDRRLLIEEAAGLGKHRTRRRRAQLKLARTQENLGRALDVEREARSRLRPLKRQAEAAELHARLERQSLELRWELTRDRVRVLGEAERAAGAAAAAARDAVAALEQALAAVGERRRTAEETLARRSAHREELGRRAYAARSAAERIGLRADAVAAVRDRVTERIGQGRVVLEALRAQDAADVPDPDAQLRRARLEQELADLERDHAARLVEELAGLEREREAASALAESRHADAERAAAVRRQAETAVEAARSAVRERERGVEVARREAARVGGELAAVNQFLRSRAGTPGGASSLADSLEVVDGYELALAAALDGRLGAALAADAVQAARLLDRAGADGGRVLLAARGPGAAETGPDVGGAGPGHLAPPDASAERLADLLSGPRDAVGLARALLADAWVVASLEAVPEGYPGLAVTRAGRVLTPGGIELRQAPHSGEERVLAERNRRDRLVAESETAAGAEVRARREQETARAALAESDRACDSAVAAHRAAVATRDEAREEERRLARVIDGRRGAPPEGALADRRRAVAAELAAERRLAERLVAEREVRAERTVRVERSLAADEATVPALGRVLAALTSVLEGVADHRERFEAELAADRLAGEEVAVELRRCAQEEAGLQGRLHASNGELTTAEVRAQRSRDQLADTTAELRALATRLELAPEPAGVALGEEERGVLEGRLERLARRREQLGAVNPLAADEYAEALAHVEELESQREDLEVALRELESLIADTDREIRRTFEETFTAAASNFEELAPRLFPGGRGRLRLVTERDRSSRVLGGQDPPSGDGAEAAEAEDETDAEDLCGVEIEITPAGKEMKRLTLLSGGEKSMTALAFLFSVFLARPCPFYILDEVEAALDDLNIGRFLDLLRQYSTRAQFIVVTHQKRTMEAADFLYGVSMGGEGISKVISRRLPPVARTEAEPAVA